MFLGPMRVTYDFLAKRNEGVHWLAEQPWQPAYALEVECPLAGVGITSRRAYVTNNLDSLSYTPY